MNFTVTQPRQRLKTLTAVMYKRILQNTLSNHRQAGLKAAGAIKSD